MLVTAGYLAVRLTAIRWRLLQVSPVQRAFVEKLLAASTFSRQLSAVRETDMLLTRAASLKTGGSEDDATSMQVLPLLPPH